MNCLMFQIAYDHEGPREDNKTREPENNFQKQHYLRTKERRRY